jgi:Lon protease-like protein
MQTDSGFGVVLLFRGNEAGTAETTTAGIGTEVRIIDFDRLPDGLLGITCRGQQRFRILRAWREADGLNMAEVEDLPAPPIVTIPADLRFLAEILERVMPELGEDYAALEARYDDAQWVSCRLAEVLAMETFERQALLELDDPLDRLQLLVKKVRGDD